MQQLKQPLELSLESEYRDQISTLRLLRCYSKALNIYMDLTHNDAISMLEEYKGLPADDSQATPTEGKPSLPANKLEEARSSRESTSNCS